MYYVEERSKKKKIVIKTESRITCLRRYFLTILMDSLFHTTCITFRFFYLNFHNEKKEVRKSFIEVFFPFHRMSVVAIVSFRRKDIKKQSLNIFAIVVVFI